MSCPQPISEPVEPSARLNPEDAFPFRCGRDRDCFGQCCKDVSILLTPYDVLRLKRAKHMDSSEFLERYTIPMQSEDKQAPVVFLKMSEDTSGCPFVRPEGCSVYAHRPWACRMYPLGLAEPEAPDAAARRFYFVVREELCHGHNGDPCTIRDWMSGQGVEAYELMQNSFRRLMYHPGWRSEELGPQKLSMFYMACYDLDRFRRFIFESRFLDFFEVDEFRVEALRSDDEELLEFAFDWLAFTLFHEPRMKLKAATAAPAAQAEAAGAP